MVKLNAQDLEAIAGGTLEHYERHSPHFLRGNPPAPFRRDGARLQLL